MGAGKSTVGRIIAKKIGIGFFDLDRIIEKNAHASVEQIFNTGGEKYFRDIESETLTDVVNNNKYFVISTGGGIVLRDKNRRIIKENGVSIYLKAGIKIIWRRISGDSTRPLLKVENPFEKAQTLLNERAVLYEQSDYILDTDDLNPADVAQRVVDIVSGKITDIN